jgi:hypothetical protein
MQRGIDVRFTALAGALILAAGLVKPASAAPPPALPDGWASADVGGKPKIPGTAAVDGSGPAAVWTITSTGGDVWDKADAGFTLAYTMLPGDGGVTARLLSRSGTTGVDWAKNGTMLRESTAADAADAFLSYASGLANILQPSFRVNTGGKPEAGKNPTDSFGSDNPPGSRKLETGGPLWMRTQRHGKTFDHLISNDGQRWQLVGSHDVNMDPAKAILAGIWASGGGSKTSNVVTYDNVAVTTDIAQAAPAGPTKLQAFPGNGQVLLTWSGVSNATGYNVYSRHANQSNDQAVLLTAKPTANGWFIDAGADNKRSLTNGTPLVYTVRAVVKDASGKSTETLDASPAQVIPQAPLPANLVAYYWGAPAPATIDLSNNVLTITAAGSDIWDVADQGVFLAAPVTGDYSVTTKLLEKPQAIAPSTTDNVKAGPMIREGTGASDPYAFLFGTSNRGILYEGRQDFREGGPGKANNFSSSAGGKGNLAPKTAKYPIWLRLTKSGTQVTGSVSTDGTTFTALAGTADFGFASPVTYTGIAMSGGAGPIGFGTAKFDATNGPIQIGAP